MNLSEELLGEGESKFEERDIWRRDCALPVPCGSIEWLGTIEFSENF